MNTDQVIEKANILIEVCSQIGEKDYGQFRGAHARVSDFLSTFAGPRSSFVNEIDKKSMPSDRERAAQILIELLKSFIAHLNDGLVSGLSPKRQAEIDVTSDLLEQAQGLLRSKSIHPAAPAVLIGATLEEFLRNWVEDKGLSLGNRKPSLDSYATTLREADFISKQDMKDIASWGGIRNHAAHGEWEELGGKPRVSIMLEGVNLFMRKYSPE